MKIFFALIVFTSLVADASPFLMSDPQCFDPTGARSECPAHYEYSESGGAWVPLDTDGDGVQIWIHHDIGGIPNNTAVTWEIRGANIWGESASVPFSFSTGVPVGPTGLVLIAP
jgi:hypothetical protein